MTARHSLSYSLFPSFSFLIPRLSRTSFSVPDLSLTAFSFFIPRLSLTSVALLIPHLHPPLSRPTPAEQPSLLPCPREHALAPRALSRQPGPLQTATACPRLNPYNFICRQLGPLQKLVDSLSAAPPRRPRTPLDRLSAPIPGPDSTRRPSPRHATPIQARHRVAAGRVQGCDHAAGPGPGRSPGRSPGGPLRVAPGSAGLPRDAPLSARLACSADGRHVSHEPVVGPETAASVVALGARRMPYEAVCRGSPAISQGRAARSRHSSLLPLTILAATAGAGLDPSCRKPKGHDKALCVDRGPG